MSVERLLAKLVSYPSVTGDTKENNKLLNYIEKQLQGYGLHVKRYTHNGYDSLLASTRKSNLKSPRLCLAAHIDVIPAPDNLFTLQVDGDKLRGRGAFDMKFAVAGYLQLLKRIKNNLSDYDIGVMITTDEETGGHDGTAWLLDQGYRPDFCILPDHGNSLSWNIEERAKGVMRVKIIAEGKTAHSSRVWEGKNAITKLGKFLYELNELHFKDQNPQTSTLSINSLKGGKESALNQVPDYAEAYLDFRFATKHDRIRLIKEAQRLAKRYDVIFDEALIDGPAHSIDTNSPLIKELVSAVERVTGDTVQYVHSHGASDARYFDPKRLECVVMGLPGGGHHSDNEWIDKTAVNHYDEVLYQFAEKTARFDTPPLTKKVKSTTIKVFRPETVASSR